MLYYYLNIGRSFIDNLFKEGIILKTCRYCKHTLTERIGSFTHFMLKKEITVHNVPHFICENCNHSFYVFPEKMDALLQDAFLKNISEVEFE